MWKVKRMNTARIVVLTIAVGAGGIAAYLASGSDNKPLPAEPVAQMQTVDVLVAKSDIGLGQSVAAEDMQWQTWPAATASSTFIRRNERPMPPLRSWARSRGRPLSPASRSGKTKLVKANGSGFMAAILPTGMRAVSTEISPETGAGGFILPNDRVDVLLSKREKNPDRNGPSDIVNSEIILSNVRVLAIDQAPKEKDGQNAVVGKTVTLELKPEQSETLARARQSGTLSLALRSIADLNAVETRSDDQRPSAATASMSFVSASQARPRRRSDRKDVRYEMQGKSALDADFHGPRPVVFGGRGADAQSGSGPGGGQRLSRAGAGRRRCADECPLSCPRHRQVGRDRSAARHQGCAGRRSEDRQRRGALGAARLHHRRDGRSDQHRILRFRRPADRRL